MGESGIQHHPLLQNKAKASLSYLGPSLKIKQTNKGNRTEQGSQGELKGTKKFALFSIIWGVKPLDFSLSG